jgi:hypothetical protein
MKAPDPAALVPTCVVPNVLNIAVSPTLALHVVCILHPFSMHIILNIEEQTQCLSSNNAM